MQTLDPGPPLVRGASRAGRQGKAPRQSSVLWQALAAGSRRDGIGAEPCEATPAENRHTLELALEAAGNIVTFAIDVARDCWVGDGRLAAMFALPVEEMRAGIATARLIERIHPEDRDRAAYGHARALAGHAEYRDEYRVAVAGSAPRWLAVRGLRTGERGRRTGRTRIVGVVTDTTPQKQHEARLEALVQERTEALRDALRKQHLLIEHHPDVLWILRVEAAPAGEEARLVFEVFNSGTHNLTGLEVATLIERTPHECLPAVIADPIVARYRACVRSGAPMTYNESHPVPVGLRH